MEAVTADAGVLEAPRNREAPDRRPETMMEGRVEAGDLAKLGPERADRTHRRQAARLVQRRERRQRVQRGNARVGDGDRLNEIAPAMDHAMAHGGERAASKIVIEPCQDIDEQAGAILVGRRAVRLVQPLS